jgi:uncharacterized protein (TIGR00251 family)
MQIKVIPKAKKEKIVETEGTLKVYLTEPAEDGKANKRLIEVLAEYFKVKKYNLEIIRGLKSRDKVIAIKK